MMMEDSGLSQKLFECCVCRSQEASRLFSFCLHTVCDDCVEKVGLADEFFCTKCNQTSDKLITNGALCKLNSQNSTPNCVWCSEGGETNTSQGHCKECGQWLCDECIKGHNRMPPFRSHTINIVGDCGDKGLKCEVHPREALELYCETCGVLTCRDCQLSVHRDHGGHRWVREKAELLRPGLISAIKALETQIDRLQSFVDSSKCSPADILSSVAAAKVAHRRSVDDLIRIIKINKASFESDLDKAAHGHISKLHKANSVIQSLMERIDYTLRLARCLVDNESKDPASLVQLAGCIVGRMEGLTDQVTFVAADAPTTVEDEKNSELADAIGWRKSASSRVLFLPSRSPEELVRFLSTVFWTADDRTLDPLQNSCGLNHDIREAEDTDDGHNNGIDGMEIETLQVLDAAALLKGGCAVCHASGSLLVCSVCYRTFHPHCHLPRLEASTTTGRQCWTCSLCSSTDTNSINSETICRIRDMCNGLRPPEEEAPEAKIWTHEQFESGCRILLSLLCHPAAFCFTSSNACPICSSDLSSIEAGDSSLENLCDVFHGLSRLRRCLELSKTRGGWSIEQWIRDIDAFTVDACAKSNDFGVPTVAETFRKAACSLRETLDSCVASHYPAFFEV